MNDTTADKKRYAELKISNKENSKIDIEGEIPVDVVHTYRSKAIAKIQKGLELPGFRKGHVPEDMVISHVGDTAIMQEIAEQAIGDVYVEIVDDNKLDVVGRPQVTITKLAAGNPIGFKITTAVYPEVKLPDYKKLAAAEMKKADDPDKIEVTDDDIGAELERLRGIIAGPAEKDEDGKDKERELPELNDEFAKKLGEFKSLDDLKSKMKAQMLMDKQQKAHEKIRLALADAVINKTKLDVPEVFINGEIDQMMASFEDRVQRAGMKMEDYLKQAGKEIEDLRKEWKPDAEKRAKLQLIFNEISKKEELAPAPERLEREVAHLKEHYKDANEQSIRIYVASQMTNDMVFRLLEGKDPNAFPKTSNGQDEESSEDVQHKEDK